MKSLIVCALTILFSSMGIASIVQVEPGHQTLEGVSIATSEVVAAHSLRLYGLGAGLRTKHVVITNVKVYVAELFGDAPTKFIRTAEAALDSITQMDNVGIRLTFLRSVDAATVQSSFRDALVANGVDVRRPDISAFLGAVNSSGDAQSGGSMNIIASARSGNETVIYEDTAGRASTIKGSGDLIRAIFSIWLGQPSDSGVAKLKAQLLQPLQQ